jgi:hypothetical protein
VEGGVGSHLILLPSLRALVAHIGIPSRLTFFLGGMTAGGATDIRLAFRLRLGCGAGSLLTTGLG